MKLIADVGHVESHFFLSRDSVSVVQDTCIVCAKRTIGLEIILDALDGTPRRRGSSESLVCLEIVVIMIQDTCTVCVECTIGVEIILDAPDRTPR
jgi:hypothetical protein